jgi:Mor family transcriptional regulator
MPHRKQIVWRSPKGDVIACVEKNKVLQENLLEIRQVCQDALEDAVLMGCDEKQVRAVFIELMNNLESSYPPQE